jgi:hypothetical protein
LSPEVGGSRWFGGQPGARLVVLLEQPPESNGLQEKCTGMTHASLSRRAAALHGRPEVQQRRGFAPTRRKR